MQFKGHRWRNSFLNPSKKKFLAFEWDLRDIDGATHFQGIALQFIFFNIFCQNMLKNEISSHKILSTISLNTFSGSFSRYCNGFFRRFECDLRDIDGATHF